MTEGTEAPKGERPSFDGKDVTLPMAGTAGPKTTPTGQDVGSEATVLEGPPAGSWVAEKALTPGGSAEKSWVDSSGQVVPADPGPSSSDLTNESGDLIGSQVTRADMGAPNQAGRRLGDFQLEKKIGQGGMGEVYKARQISLDRPVAVKVLTRGLASQPGFVERFQREAKAAANVVHPHIIQIYAYGIDNGTPYFAMEYVEGEDLQQRMRRVKKMPIDEIVDTMIATASALGGAHERNMIHRDVKPSNVMIDRSGNVKVMDFGLAKAASADGSLTQSGVIMGTPNYLSPEQGRGDPIDGRADLYSLGVVMYELLAGDLPFRADTPAGLIFKHVYEDPLPLSKRNAEVPKFVEEIVHKLLRKDPADRYQNAKELLVDLHEFLDARDHYVSGGARRSGGLSTSSRLRGQARGGETTMTDAPAVGPEDAPTQPTPRKDVALVESPNNRSQVTIIREKPSLAPLWILLFTAALGGGTYVLHQNGTLAKWGILQRQLKLQLATTDLPAGVAARLESLDGPTKIDLKPDEGNFLDAGKYRITVDRKGYQRIRTDLFVQDDNGRASLVMPSGTQFQFRYEPTPEMVEAYTKGREAIARGRSTGDKEAYGDARVLLAKVEDPSFAMGGEKSARELQDEALRALDEGKKLLDDAQKLAKAKSWRKLLEKATPYKGLPEWERLTDEAKKMLGVATAARDAAQKAQEKGDFETAQTKLAEALDADPEDTSILTQKATVLALANKRTGALDAANAAVSQADLEKAKGLLVAYLGDVKGDALAVAALQKVEDKIKHDLAAPLATAIKASDWARADVLWNELKRSQPQHEKLGAWRTQIDAGKREIDVRAAVDALDSALEQADPLRALDRLLDGGSEAMKAERRQFAQMKEANARFLASKHSVTGIKVEASGPDFVAHVEARWKLAVEVDGERIDLDRVHAMDLKQQGGGEWKFTSFVSSEGSK